MLGEGINLRPISRTTAKTKTQGRKAAAASGDTITRLLVKDSLLTRRDGFHPAVKRAAIRTCTLHNPTPPGRRSHGRMRRKGANIPSARTSPKDMRRRTQLITAIPNARQRRPMSDAITPATKPATTTGRSLRFRAWKGRLTSALPIIAAEISTRSRPAAKQSMHSASRLLVAGTPSITHSMLKATRNNPTMDQMDGLASH